MPFEQMFQMPSSLMNLDKVNPLMVYLLTVIHSSGLVTAAAITPATNEAKTFNCISLYLNSFGPYLILNCLMRYS